MIIIKSLYHGTVANGSTFSASWDSDDNYNIKYIFIKADGNRTTKSTITIRINNVPITKDKALCNTFGSNPEDAIELNIPLERDRRIEIEGVNDEGADKLITVELVLEK